MKAGTEHPGDSGCTVLAVFIFALVIAFVLGSGFRDLKSRVVKPLSTE